MSAVATDDRIRERISEFVDDPAFMWRLEMFGKLGFDTGQRAKLAALAADWQQGELLIKAGCPIDIAYDLLLPE